MPCLVIGVVFGLLQVLGALAMWRLRWYGLAVVASILALIISPGNLIGLPIGIWALVILSRQDVQAAFASATGFASAAKSRRPTPHSGTGQASGTSESPSPFGRGASGEGLGHVGRSQIAFDRRALAVCGRRGHALWDRVDLANGTLVC